MSVEYCRSLTASTRATYNSIGIVHCPALKADIVFNARGFHHLLYEPDGTARTVRERVYKLSLLPLVTSVVRSAVSIAQERNVMVRDGRTKKAQKKSAKMYALVARVGKEDPIDVRVIILRIGNGNHMFWSVMKN